jgi:hypothetical protein
MDPAYISPMSVNNSENQRGSQQKNAMSAPCNIELKEEGGGYQLNSPMPKTEGHRESLSSMNSILRRGSHILGLKNKGNDVKQSVAAAANSMSN